MATAAVYERMRPFLAGTLAGAGVGPIGRRSLDLKRTQDVLSRDPRPTPVFYTRKEAAARLQEIPGHEYVGDIFDSKGKRVGPHGIANSNTLYDLFRKTATEAFNAAEARRASAAAQAQASRGLSSSGSGRGGRVLTGLLGLLGDSGFVTQRKLGGGA